MFAMVHYFNISVSVLLKALFTVSLQTNMYNCSWQRVMCEQKSTFSFIGLCLVPQQESAAGEGAAIILYCFMVLK